MKDTFKSNFGIDRSRQAIRACICAVAFGSSCVPALLAAADSDFDEPVVEQVRPRVSLVLSGGGARGLAHVGVLQVLEELRVPVDCVVGTSMGALVGGAYASGVRPADMRAALRETAIETLFDDLPPRAQIPQRVKRDDYKPLFDFTLGYNDGQVRLPTGASAGYKFELFLKDLIGPGASVAGLDFDALSTPFRAIATDLESGDMKVFEHGDLPKVMRASMSLPALVAPVDIDGRIYVDGGLVRNLPVDIGRGLCGDVIVAVNLGTPLKTRDQLRNVIDVAGQSLNLLTEQNVKRSLTELTDQDILIEPDLKGFESSDFDSGDLIIERGVQAVRQIAHQLERLVVDDQTYDVWLTQRERQRLPSPLVTAIEVASNERFSEKVIEGDLDVEAGEAFSREQLHSDLARLYGRADFSYLGYSVVPVDDGAVVNIEAEAKPWGPGYLKFGIGVAADFTSPAQPNLAASYRRTWANSLGAEWRVDGQIGYESFLSGEFLQPFQERDGVFIAPHADARRRFIQFYGDDRRLGQLRINSVLGGIDLGLTGATAELRLGPYVADIHTDPDFGAINSLLPSAELTQFGLKLAAVADHLDDSMFPSAGWLAAIGARTTDKDWGSEDEYTVAQVTLRGVKSIGKHTLAVRAEWGDGVNGEIPAYESFQLGGPLRLSGLFLDQLTGTRYNLGSINYYRQYSQLPSQFGRGLYIGMSVESGRINDPLMKEPWDWVTSGSIYWGADTVLGAIYIGYGYSSLKQGIMYLTIGPRF